MISPPDFQYDLSGELLKYLLTNLKTGSVPASDWAPADTDFRNKGVMKKFNQKEFVDTYVWQLDGLAPYGYIFYPYQCYDGSRSCKVHMYFHGGASAVDGALLGFDVLLYGGWYEYAAANDIILIQPQARTHFLLNPYGTFEW